MTVIPARLPPEAGVTVADSVTAVLMRTEAVLDASDVDVATFTIEIVWATEVALAKYADPDWPAVTEQVPELTRRRVVPETVHTVEGVAVKVTGKALVAVALSA